MTNEEIIKTLKTSDFVNGGELNPQQQAKFIQLVFDQSVLLKLVRGVPVNQAKVDIDKLYVGEPITESAEEDEAIVDSTMLRKPSFSKIEIACKKLRSIWNVSTEALQSNIEKTGFEDSLMEAMTKRISTDMELLAIRGDATTYAADTTKLGKLLKRSDGWMVKTDGAHVLDVGGQTISKKVFAEMIRMMPEQYLADPGLRFIVSKVIGTDWLDLVADRATSGGDAALEGKGARPYGIPIQEVPLIPSNLSVTPSAAEATPGWLEGSAYGPFTITEDDNDTFKMDVDNAGVQEVVIAAGTYTTSELCALINAAHASFAGVARDNGQGQILLKSTTTGAGSEIDIQASSEHSILETLGLEVAVNAGSDTGTDDTVPEGSFIWLCNPKNFIKAILKGTRVYNEFNQRRDRFEFTIYNQVDHHVENLDAVVKAVNLRKRTLL